METDKYIPALRFDWLTTIYDPIVRLTTRETAFKTALIKPRLRIRQMKTIRFPARFNGLSATGGQ